jgi:hypothetical protein
MPTIEVPINVIYMSDYNYAASFAFTQPTTQGFLLFPPVVTPF